MGAVAWGAASSGVGLAFEGVVEVGVTSAKRRHQTCEQIRGYEQGPPALALLDVDTLVVSREIERLGVAAQHDVAECHGRSAAANERSEPQEDGGEAPVDFEYAADQARASARKQ